MYTQYMYNDSLAHHGILGQKWGVLNGPPYPLSYQSHSSEEKKKNSTSRIDGISKHNKPKTSGNRLVKENKKSSTGKNIKKSKKKSNLTPQQRKERNKKLAIAFVATAAGLTVVALAATKGRQIAKGRKLVRSSINSYDKFMTNKDKLIRMSEDAHSRKDYAYEQQLWKRAMSQKKMADKAAASYLTQIKNKSNNRYLRKNLAKLRSTGKISISDSNLKKLLESDWRTIERAQGKWSF